MSILLENFLYILPLFHIKLKLKTNDWNNPIIIKIWKLHGIIFLKLLFILRISIKILTKHLYENKPSNGIRILLDIINLFQIIFIISALILIKQIIKAHFVDFLIW